MSETKHECTSDAVLIVGAGPVGLSLAAELARQQVPCRIVDKGAGPSVHSKALAVFPRTLEAFARLGVAEAMLAEGHRLTGLNVHVGENEVAQVSLEHLDTPYPFVLVLPQSRTEEILAAHLAEQGIEVEWECELDGLTQDNGCVRVELSGPCGGSPIRAPWLVACDGAHSFVRKSLELEFRGSAYEEAFLLADARLEGELETDELHAFFHHKGALALVPIHQDIWRVIVADAAEDNAKTKTAQTAEEKSPPTLAELQAYLEERGPGDITLHDPEWTSRFHVSRRQVKNWRQGRVFLAGDAAHICSPAGGQGMNLGIQDAANLGWKLGLVTAGRASAELLNTYGQEREPIASDTLTLTDRLTKVITLENSFLQHARNTLLSLLSQVPRFEQRFAESLSELATHYHGGPLSQNDTGSHFARGNVPWAGDRAPDVKLQSVAAENVPLFDLLRDPRHVLLLFQGDAREANPPEFVAMRQLVREKYEDVVTVYDVLASASVDPPPEVARFLFDAGQAHTRYGAREATCVLIRPDGYIAYRGCPPHAKLLGEYLRRVFTGPPREQVPAAENMASATMSKPP